MTKQVWESMKQKAEKFFYSSFRGLDYEQVQDYVVIKDTIDVILLYGTNKSHKINEVHWATNYPSLIITESQELKEEVLIPLVPTMWESEFLLAGFYHSDVNPGYLKKELVEDMK